MPENKIEIKKVIPSQRKSIKVVEPMLQDIRDRFGIAPDKFYNVLIAVTEAVNNAIHHGNECFADKMVTIELRGDEHSLFVGVQDEGTGFEPEEVADPRDAENLLKEHGRGVFLIKQLTTRHEYVINDRGTRINMYFDF